MKRFNYKSWAQSPRLQKWGLFGLLAVSLGFNLSMNPEHFNNIARHERSEAYQMIDLAQTAAPAAAAVAPATKTVVAQPAASEQKVSFDKGGKSYQGTVTAVKVAESTITVATVKELCSECLAQNYDIPYE